VADDRVRVPIEANLRARGRSGSYERFAAGSKLGKIVLEAPG
jgi:hypothetical protein